jgi:hypothetical protein
MRRWLTFFLPLTFAFTTLGHSQSKKRPSPIKLSGPAFSAMQKVNPENIRAHVRFLSHDLLEGRGTGQRGGDIAAEYIATQFALYGLKPAGENGSYLQKVPMVGITPGDATTSLLINTLPMTKLRSRNLMWMRPLFSSAMVSKRRNITGMTTKAWTLKAKSF